MLYINRAFSYISNYTAYQILRGENVTQLITAVTARVLIALLLVTFAGSYIANPDGKFYVYSSQARSVYLVFCNVCIPANPSYKRLK